MNIEREIVRKASAGDMTAFEQLVALYEKKIYMLAYRNLGNEQDALDISQEVFLRVFRFLPGFKGDSSFSTWIYRIAINMCKDFMKKRRYGTEVPLHQQGEDDEEYQIEVSDFRFNPESEAERKEMVEELGKALDTLSDQHREVLVMREISGKSYLEIAELLKLDVGTVKSRISRAREKLREYLTKSGTFSP